MKAASFVILYSVRWRLRRFVIPLDTSRSCDHMSPHFVHQSVHLHCNHTFHGQCIATALQLDRRCPLCRTCPNATSHDSEEPFEEGFNDAVSASVVRIMSKIPTRIIRQLLRIFDVRVNSFTLETLATALSEQLHYETDSEVEDEVEDVDCA